MNDSLLIFGGGELQFSIIKKALKMGYIAVVIDPNPNAIAREIASVFIEVKNDDYKKTLEIAKQYDVKGLITAATDHPILMMCRIASELKLPFPSFESCYTFLDKGLFKTFLKEHSFPYASGGVYHKADNIDNTKFDYPLIVKPLQNSGSRGVIKCESPAKLSDSINETLNFCKDGRFIIEEYLDGDEISVEAFVNNNVVQIIQITDKLVTPSPYNVELGHIQPSKYLSRAREIQDILQKIVDYTGLNNCIIHPEFKINGNLITIIEIGPRLGGDYITSRLVPLSTNINLEEILINIATKKSFHYDRIEEKSSQITYFNFPVNEIVKNLITEKEIKQLFPEIVEFRNNLKIGTRILPITNSLNRYGYFIVQADKLNGTITISDVISKYIKKKIFEKQ